jgi:hypothetical protein
MLRFKPTVLELDARDLEWHAERHKNRKRENYEQTSRSGPGEASLAYRLPLPPRDNHSVKDGREIESKAPVPQYSQRVWDDVMKAAGVEFNPPLRQPPLRSTPIAYKLASSISGEAVPDSKHLDLNTNILEAELNVDNSPDSSCEYTPCYDQTTSSSEKNEDGTKASQRSSHLSQQSKEKTPRKHRLSFLKFHRKGHKVSSEEPQSQEVRKIIKQHTFDGSQDEQPHKRDMCVSQHSSDIPSAALLAELEEISGRLQLGSLRPSDSFPSPASSYTSLVSEDDGFTRWTADYPKTQLRSVEKVKSFSGHMPRSPLYISHAADSNSPEKASQRPTVKMIMEASENPCRTPLPPREPRLPAPGTQGQIFCIEEDDYSANTSGSEKITDVLDLGSFGVDGSATASSISIHNESEHRSRERSSPNWETYPDPEHNHWEQGNPESSSRDPKSLRLRRSPAHSPFTYQDTYASSEACIRTPQSLPKLPSPFSEIPRVVSNDFITSSPLTNPFGNPMLSTNGASMPADNPRPATQRRLSTYAATFVPATMQHRQDFEHTQHYRQPTNSNPAAPAHTAHSPTSLSPMPPQTPRRIPVYDDGLPNNSQPQTPVGLPRHGIFPMPGPFTAPQPRHARTTWRDLPHAGLVWHNGYRMPHEEGRDDEENIASGMGRLSIRDRSRPGDGRH